MKMNSFTLIVVMEVGLVVNLLLFDHYNTNFFL